MCNKRRYILSAAILAISLSLWLPIWRIEIRAPQYPEGLALKISASQIEGNVDQINILNHYIGMKHIVPSEIPELTIIPWVIMAIVASGILTVIFNKILLVRLWFATISALAVVGLIDFYKWGYDYGHNLSPDAPIKIPGFTYQPPLLGYKKILNIEAYSLPDLGAYALLVGFLLTFCVVFWKPIQKFLKERQTCFLKRFRT